MTLLTKSTSLADVRTQLSEHVEDVMRTHERVTITRNGRPAAVLISAEDLEAMEETLFWASPAVLTKAARLIRTTETATRSSSRRQPDGPWLTCP